MPRRDRYGTRDEECGYGSRDRQSYRADRELESDARGSSSMDVHDYGSREERRIRTSRGGHARFQGRDYERENYGGGYGVQRLEREWRKPRLREWRGQVGASGMDGLASERAFGTENNEQMSALDSSDAAYRRWRRAELDAHDAEYRAWRRRQAQQYDEDYARWKATREREA